jgi:hypothetical protein
MVTDPGKTKLYCVHMERRFRLATVLRTLTFVLSAGLFLFSLGLAWAAFRVPLELEIREGTEWIHVLAKNAGVDIYDGKLVAFVNMNHGPMDAMLKTWLSRAIPILPGYMVTRIFVLLMPVCLLGSAYVICRRNLTNALLAAATLHLVLVDLTNMTLVGRSDATVLCGLAVCAALADRIVVNSQREWQKKRVVVQKILLGSVSAVVLLACWRSIPIIAAIYLIVLVGVLAWSSGSRVRTLLSTVGLPLAGFALVGIPTFFFELHGYVDRYYKRFFGFFSAASGWGTFPGSEFYLFPASVVRPRQEILLLMLALISVAAYRLRQRWAELAAWLVMLPAVWGIHAFMYYKNQGGGGLHYFAPFFFFAWLMILHGLRSRSQPGRTVLGTLGYSIACMFPWRGWFARWDQRMDLRAQIRPLAQLTLVCLIVALLPWRGLLAERKRLADLRPHALKFLENAATRSDGEAVFGEEMHLYKTKYRNEVVDTGDTASAIARSGYFGKAFNRTFETYVSNLLAQPPRFVMAGLLNTHPLTGTMSPELLNLLSNRYDLVLQSPGTMIANGGTSMALFERKSP